MIPRQRTAGKPGEKRFKKRNRPPTGEPWIWLTQEMLESESWCAMPLAARKVVERVAIEHMAHGGTINGELPVTYEDFAKYGVRRTSVKAAIAVAIGLGWIDRVVRGVRSYGSARRPSQYGLTWLPRSDWTDANNRWKGITKDQAQEIVATLWSRRRREAAGDDGDRFDGVQEAAVA